jgi:hypothetical protein
VHLEAYGPALLEQKPPRLLPRSRKVENLLMGRGSRPVKRWKNDRQRKKKEREKRKRPAALRSR